MVDYYKILRVSSKASNAEIKSAYRRLARKLHPDKNDGSEETAREFAKVAKAYEVLGNPKQRAEYDRRILQEEFGGNSDDSVFGSSNEYARRWRQMVYERRYNEIIDRMIADERRESVALQKIIFPLVGLFVSTFAVAVLKPAFFATSPIVIQIAVVTLAVIGVIHLISRIRDAFEKYTYDENIHDSILEDAVPDAKPFSRALAVSFIVAGVFVSLGVGLLLSNYVTVFISSEANSFYSPYLRFESVFYPPIVVLCVDVMHSLASRFD